ncbi:unnamed protein product [Protopolystoma xenopodis]|uniref:Uncharacterized protein n=1 Tax=Protopolystoma xenopodis TaxID=117903 RepID=A0A3S5B3C1_9PLAT|nr:unnamed protein product [Protopolystoma xenopodis]
MPGPPFAFGALLVLSALLVSMLIPENPHATRLNKPRLPNGLSPGKFSGSWSDSADCSGAACSTNSISTGKDHSQHYLATNTRRLLQARQKPGIRFAGHKYGLDQCEQMNKDHSYCQHHKNLYGSSHSGRESACHCPTHHRRYGHVNIQVANNEACPICLSHSRSSSNTSATIMMPSEARSPLCPQHLDEQQFCLLRPADPSERYESDVKQRMDYSDGGSTDFQDNHGSLKCSSYESLLWDTKAPLARNGKSLSCGFFPVS